MAPGFVGRMPLRARRRAIQPGRRTATGGDPLGADLVDMDIAEYQATDRTEPHKTAGQGSIKRSPPPAPIQVSGVAAQLAWQGTCVLRSTNEGPMNDSSPPRLLHSA